MTLCADKSGNAILIFVKLTEEMYPGLKLKVVTGKEII